MSFLFAYLGTLSEPRGWPVELMHRMEIAFAAVAFACLILAIVFKGRGPSFWRGLIVFAGGVSTSFALIMPFELAPFFFDARGEWMMATILLNLVYLPAAALFIVMFLKSMKVRPG